MRDHKGLSPDLSIQQMHFIIVSNDLDKYYHLHPTQKKEGSYVVEQFLNDETYQDFVDIAPENKAYQITPNTLQVGAHEMNKIIP